MSELEATCIYCQQVVDPHRGEGDHVIPAAPGRFEGEFRFRRICQDCNSLIGKCEEQLLRCSPEAYLRRLVQPNVKRSNRGKSWVGASHGMKPPKFTVDHGDHHELVKGSTEDPRNVYPVDQLVIVDKDDGEHHVPLFPKMTAAHVRAKIEELGVTPDRIRLRVDEAEYPKYITLLKELHPDWTLSEAEDLEPGEHRVKGRTAFTFHVDYWRAIAKIGFHYYLLNSRRGKRGDEPEFGDIRRFIIEGGDRESFFTKPAVQFALPFGELPGGNAILPHIWAHILAADETANAAVAMVSLFMGPEHLAPTYHLNIGQFASPLIVPRARYAHAYTYNGEPSIDGYTGRVVEKSLSQLDPRSVVRR